MRRAVSVGVAWLAMVGLGSAMAGGDDPVLGALVAEVERAMAELKKVDPPPYFLGVEVLDEHSLTLIAEEGGLQGTSPLRRRWVDVDIRVGGAQLDSTHALRNVRESGRRFSGRRLALTDDQALLRRDLWREIDRRFGEARKRWAKVQSEGKTLVREDEVEDLATTEPIQAEGELGTLTLDTARWEDVLRKASALLAPSRVCNDGSVRLKATVENRWFVSSEGARVRHSQARYRVTIRVDSVAADGDKLDLHHSWEAHTAAGLPAPEEVYAKVRELDGLLAAIRVAPLQGPYSGPAILSGRAAGVFFHEIFGHRVEGHRLKQVKDAQTFRTMVGKRILPASITVYDDPTLSRFGKRDLYGHYRYDNQGIAARRATLVKDGVLEGFLESRSPSTRAVRSNGHGRRQRGRDVVTRQGILVIRATGTVGQLELRRRLQALAKERGLEYGLLIEEIHGGFTFTGRRIPNAFNVNVVQAKRIYVDGRPDELVRGIDFIGTPLVTFSRVLAAADEDGVFNGFCGAESGSVPVSAVAPVLLLSEVETQRKAKAQNAPPLLPPPTGEDAGAPASPRKEVPR